MKGELRESAAASWRCCKSACLTRGTLRPPPLRAPHRSACSRSSKPRPPVTPDEKEHHVRHVGKQLRCVHALSQSIAVWLGAGALDRSPDSNPGPPARVDVEGTLA